MGDLIEFRRQHGASVGSDVEWERVVRQIEDFGLLVGVITHKAIEGFRIDDCLTFETRPGIQVEPEAFPLIEQLRLMFENDAAVRERMVDYYWSVGGVVQSA